MEFIFNNWWLILIILVCLGLLLMPSLTGQNSGLTPEQATQLINRKNAILVDLRDQEAFAAEHISGAKNIPAKQLEEKLSKAVKNKALPIILVCYTGVTAFSNIKKVQKLGYANVQSLAGGMKAWHNANLPTKHNK